MSDSIELLPPGTGPHDPAWHELRRAGVTASEIAAACVTSGCTRPVSCRGRCHTCYTRGRYRGEIAKLPPPRPRDQVAERIVQSPTGCWLWSGTLDVNGYGYIRLTGGVRWQAHRFSYEAFVGPIAEGLTLDHLCRVRSCVNPEHLEPCASWENRARGTHPTHIAMRTDRCVNGHEFTPENTRFRRNGNRSCRECGRNATRRWQARQR